MRDATSHFVIHQSRQSRVRKPATLTRVHLWYVCVCVYISTWAKALKCYRQRAVTRQTAGTIELLRLIAGQSPAGTNRIGWNMERVVTIDSALPTTTREWRVCRLLPRRATPAHTRIPQVRARSARETRRPAPRPMRNRADSRRVPRLPRQGAATRLIAPCGGRTRLGGRVTRIPADRVRPARRCDEHRF